MSSIRPLGSSSSANGIAVRRRNAYIKDPGLDPVIRMTRDRRKKELEQDTQKRSVAGIAGGVLHKQLQLGIIEKEIAQLQDGVQEFQNMIDLLEEQKSDIRKGQVEDREWCATFDSVSAT